MKKTFLGQALSVVVLKSLRRKTAKIALNGMISEEETLLESLSGKDTKAALLFFTFFMERLKTSLAIEN